MIKKSQEINKENIDGKIESYKMKKITRIPFYDILANPEYRSKFEYESVIQLKNVVLQDFEKAIFKKF